MEAVITTTAGLIGGWLISHFYYRRSNKESERSTDQMRNDIIEEFRAEALDRIKNSFDETERIEEVLTELWDEIKKKKGEEFGKGNCPRCASENIEVFWVSYGEDQEMDVARCNNCGLELT